MSKIITVLFILCCCLGMRNASAVAVDNVYEADMPVASQTEAERMQIFAPALAQVLVKLSGNASIKTLTPIQNNLDKAKFLVQEYHYYQVAPEINSSSLMLKIKFNRQAVNNLLTQAGVPIWNSNRPLVLVWFAQMDKEPKIINADNGQTLTQIFQLRAKQRGLPILFPALDLDDLNIVALADVTAPNLPILRQASARYASDLILALTLSSSAPNNWSAVWSLAGNNNPIRTWNTTASTADTAITLGMDKLVDSLPKSFISTQTQKSGSHLRLVVTQITDMNAYSKITAYLRTLTAVTDVQVINIEPNQVIFDITLRSDRQDLIQALNTEHFLLPLTQPNSSADLVYQWAP